MNTSSFYFSGQLGDGTFAAINRHITTNQRTDIMIIRSEHMRGNEDYSIETSHIADFDQKTIESLSASTPVVFDTTFASGHSAQALFRILEDRRIGGINLPEDKPIILITKNANEDVQRLISMPYMQRIDTLNDLLSAL